MSMKCELNSHYRQRRRKGRCEQQRVYGTCQGASISSGGLMCAWAWLLGAISGDTV
jgi:hypothetical protein